MTLEIDLFKRLTSRKIVVNADYRFSARTEFLRKTCMQRVTVEYFFQ